MTEAPQPPLEHRRRKTWIVDPAMQFGALFTVVGIAGGFLLLWVVSQAWSAGDRGGDLTGAQASRLAVLADVLFVALALVTVAIYVVWLTHRVAGPARAIRDALDGMVDGDFERRLTLRRKDFLKEVADAAGRVATTMRAEQGATVALVDELERRLARHDVAGAGSLLQAFRFRRYGSASDLAAQPPVEPTSQPTGPGCS